MDLLLVNARYDNLVKIAELQLTEVVDVDLARAIADGAVFSAARLLQDLIRYAESQDDRDPAWGFAGRQTGRNVGEGLIYALLSSLPVDLKVLWKQGRHDQVC